jgi:hypothetical protein
MAREFQNIKPDGTWSTHKTLDQTMDAARAQCESGLQVYTLTKDGKKVRRGTRRWVLRGLRRVLGGGSPGPVYRVWGGGDVLFTCRETVPALHVVDTSGNDKIDLVWSFGKAQFPDCTFLGAYVCKHVYGTSTMSQHSYGNAVDFGRDSMSELYDLAHYLVAHADELDLQHVIVDDVIWIRGYGWSHYGGTRHHHVHADCTPQYSGSCGVRN